MSGIEVVGIVLGAIPLVISGLEHYAEGARTIKSMWDYPQEFKNSSCRLRTEDAIFRNTMELLLSGCVGTRGLEDMLTQPGGNAWAETQVEQELHLILQGSYNLFLESIVAMNEALTAFIKRLRLDPDGKGPFNKPNSFSEAYKRFRFALKKSAYLDLVEEIVKDNTALNRLVQQSSTLEPTRSSRRRPSTKNVRANASSMFTGLQKAIDGPCKPDHIASLYIKATDRNTRLHGKPEEYIGGEAFRVVLHHTTTAGQVIPWLCKETEIRLNNVIIDETKTKAPVSPRNAAKSKVRFADQGNSHTTINSINVLSGPQLTTMIPEIQDLCSSIIHLQAQDCGVCLGYLADASKLLRFGLFRPKTPIFDTDSLSMLSLGEILSSKTNDRRLSVANRSRLAASLALGLLCLHDTPWLASQWGHNEINFFCSGGRILAEHPFLSTSLGTQSVNANPVAYFEKTSAIADESMFALGILLIELCLHQSFEELLSPAELNPDGTKHEHSVHLAALRLVNTVDDEASCLYGDAIRYCIQSPINQRIASLDNDAFQEAVYVNVFAALEEVASHFPPPRS